MRNCKHCGSPIVRKAKEEPYRFNARVYCGRACSDPGRYPKTKESALERFNAYVLPEPMSGCWLWTGPVTRGGYGAFGFLGRKERAPRVAYQFLKGEIPPGALIRHRCDTPLCVNPDHLELGDHRDNSNDAVARGRAYMGERHRDAKLTGEQVSAILTDARPQREIASDYGVSPSAVCLIKKRRNWRHIAINQTGECEDFSPRRQPGGQS